MSALSCFVLALLHGIYGPGQDSLALTKEYLNKTHHVAQETPKNTRDFSICSKRTVQSFEEDCDEAVLVDTSIVPRLIIFSSQFLLGIGTTLYYVLGQPYIDDNTKKKNTPMVLGKCFTI